MFLSDAEIREYIQDKRIQITPPYKSSDLRQCGLRVHLSNIIYELNETDNVIDLRNENLNSSAIQDIFYNKINLESFSLGNDSYILSPGESVIGSTVESFILPNDMIILLDGRSTLARFGITIHISAAIVDSLNLKTPKSITLEVFNLGKHKFTLYNNMPIAMVLFGLLSSESTLKPSEHYVGRQVLPNVQYVREKGIL